VKKPGIEIGPSHNPICPKSEGYDVEIIDHLSQEHLRAKYADHGVRLDAIEPVDHVWKGESYVNLTGKPRGYGWVIASHVIEHTPDLIRFLQGCDEILEEDGVLVLAIPDKRYCFDHLRPKSSLAAVIDAYEAQRVNHSVGTAAEYFMNVCAVKNGIPWKFATPASLHMIHTREDALSGMQALRNAGSLDLHAWCFTPSSFRLMISDLYDLGFIKCREIGFFPTEGHEFFISLGRGGRGPGVPRINLAVASGQE
jgi:hypothetical protein